jgi:hypothetical protein
MFTDPDIQLHADKIRDDGYTVIERAAEADLVEGLKQALERIEREHGFGCAKTSFEGFKTVRINNLLTYDDIFREVPLHDNVLPIVEGLLDKECLLSSFCSLVLGPGQGAADPRGYPVDSAAASAHPDRHQCDLGVVGFHQG